MTLYKNDYEMKEKFFVHYLILWFVMNDELGRFNRYIKFKNHPNLSLKIILFVSKKCWT